MTVARFTDLVDVTCSLHLLEPIQQDQVATLRPRFPEPKELARELLRRGWLTPYQINQIFQGRGSDLLLGSYVLLERLGEGGMGTVFKARNWKLGQLVALKLIRADRLAGPEAVQRFRREIRVVAQLSHPNIVTAHDADEVAGTHFLVMEYAAGIDLGRLVRQRGPLPVSEACEYVRQAALGLQHAFEHGVIHRDIKPSNLLLVGAGAAGQPPVGHPRIKVLDFGLARCATSAEDLSSTLTTEGRVMGTPDFMAPEQTLDSRDVDTRADLYSLGCTLYFLLTAQPPFPGGTVGQKIARHLAEEPPPLDRLRPDVPSGVAAVVRKLLAKRPEDRYQTPAGLAVVLQFGGAAGQPPRESVLVSTMILPAKRSPGRRLTRRHLLAAGGITLLLTGGGLALSRLLIPGEPITSKGPSPPGGRPPVPRGPLPLTHLDEARIGREDLEAAGLSEGQEVLKGLTAVLGDCRQGAGAFRAVAWSPDGELLAAAGDDRVVHLWRSVQDTKVELLQGHLGFVFTLAFAGDSTALLSGGTDARVRVWNRTTARKPFALGGAGPPGHVGEIHAVACSPVGDLTASCSVDKKVKLWDSRLGSLLDTLPAAEEEPFLETVESVAFSPDGKVLAAGCHDGQVRLWDAETRKPLDSLPRQERGVYRSAFSGDGRWLAVAFRSGSVLLWDLGARQVAHSWKTAHASIIEGLAFSPKGKVLATAGADGMVRLWDLARRAQIQQIAVAPAASAAQKNRSLGSVAFSPDGRYLATANPNGTVYILRVAP